MLTQLLPSSTVAAGVKLKRGFGTVASEIPGGTCQAAARSPGVSGDTRDPSQYWLMKFGAPVELPELKTLDPPAVSTESVARSVTPEPWLVGPVSPRTPISQYWVPLTQAPVPPVMVVLPAVVVELSAAG